GPALHAGGTNFGQAVAIQGDTILVSAPSQNTSKGLVDSFSLVGGTCSSASQCGSGFCQNGFCCDKPCTDSCDVCAQSLGASADGFCTTAPAGYVGGPACAPKACDGSSTTCQVCTTDQQCTADHYCAADGSCLARKTGGAACDLTAGADCLEGNCRAC